MKTERTTNLRTARILKFAAGVFTLLLIGYGAFSSWLIWNDRTRTVTLPARPLAVRDDATALALAHAAMRELGYDPGSFTAQPFWGGVLCGRNERDPDFGSFAFNPASGPATPDRPGISVHLEQRGTTVVCSVSRAK